MWIHVLDQDPLTSFVCNKCLFRERCVRQLSQIVDVRQLRVAESKTEDVKDPLSAMDGAPVVSESASDHLRP